MNKTLMTAIAFFAFGLGCVASTVYAPLAVPPAKAKNTTRWEQLCVPSYDSAANKSIANEFISNTNNPKDGWNRVLKQYGQEGWELVEVVHTGGGDKRIHAVCFKRPL